MASILDASSRDSISTYSQDAGPSFDAVAFQSLDDPGSLESLTDKVGNTNTKNFVVDFDDASADAAFDLDGLQLNRLLSHEHARSSGTRWLNMWFPFQQRHLLELLGKRYDFSPRLLGLMCSDPRPRSIIASSQGQSHRRRKSWSRRNASLASQSGAEKCNDELSEHSSIASHDSAHGGNLYRIVEELWHYSSIDLGRSYACLGYNSLYGTKPSTNADSPLPQCTRVWTWLILCSDNTVITINENPFPDTVGYLDAFQQRVHAETRRNLLNVFRSLSLIDTNPLHSRNPMTLLPLRARLGNTPEESAHRTSDTPGLLFYYLFENWHNSYTLITRKESRYGLELAQLRREMVSAPQLCHIDRLDRIGTELGVLKKHYEGYRCLIDRILEPTPVTQASLENSQVTNSDAGSDSAASVNTVRPLIAEKDSRLGVSLASTARARFTRLRDLIDLYALNEIEEYLKQKDSLVSLNFSLLTFKESLDVERLTRITLLLTKATMLFLPVSLMTAYFSVPLRPIQDDQGGWTVTQYWASFAVTFALSFCGLVVFGVMSGSVQVTEVWKGFVGGMRKAGRCLRRIGGDRE